MKVGFVGVGNMGGPMCRNLIRNAGHEVSVFDMDRAAVGRCVDAGGHAATSLRDLAQQSDIVITSLPTPRHVEQVTLGEGGLRAHMRRGSTYIDLSTNAPSMIKRIAGSLQDAGIGVLEAPVSGGVAGATAASIVVMVGGDAGLYERHVPLLRSFSAKTVHVGDIGTASVAKLVNNMIALTNMAVCSEALMIAASTGISLQTLDSVITAASGDSAAYRTFARKVAARDFDPNFSLDLAYKDISLALDLATENGIPVLFASQAAALMRMGRGLGLGPADCSSMINVLERQLGFEARWPDEPAAA